MADKQHDPVLQQRLEEYITEVGSQEKASDRIGYSAGTLSQYRKGIYSGDVVKLESKLREVFEVKAAVGRFESCTINYVPTSISEQVYMTIRLCHLRGGLATECGDAGIGKTKAAQKYAADYPNSAIYICLNPCISSERALLRYICQKLHLNLTTRDDMWMQIDEYLSGEQKVLIFDEAQNLPFRTLESIRSWSDREPANVGIVFIGNEKIISQRNGNQKANYMQVNNRTRLSEVRRASKVTLSDMKLLCPALVGHEKELQLLHVISQSEQCIRGAMNVYINARDNDDLSYGGLLAAAKSTIGLAWHGI